MKTFAALLVLAAAAAPAAAQDPVDEKLAKLEMRVQEQLNKAFAFHKQLLERVMKLEERIQLLEIENQRLKIDLERLGRKGPGDPAPTPAPVDPAFVETAAKIDAAIAKLKSGGPAEDAARELMPNAKWAAPKLVEAIGKNSLDLPFLAKAEQVLSKFPVEDLKGPLAEGLRDQRRRASMAKVVAGVGDRELSKVLEPHVSDANPYTQIEIGTALLVCRNRAGVPPLLKVLRAEESEYRLLAIMRLKAVTNGDLKGYDFNKSAADNAEALKAWDAWWEKDGPKLFP